MSLKITKEKKRYSLSTSDYVGLQMVLVFRDTILNKSGIDPIMLEIYGEGGHKDPHSSTMFKVFVESIGGRMFDVEDSARTKHSFYENQLVKTKRGEVPAKELLPDDEFV